MKRNKKIASMVVAIAIVLALAVPAVSYALPTSYSGNRVYSGGQYKSYTWTNGYEAGGNVTNTVQAYIGDTSYSRYSTYTGENSVYSQGSSYDMLAYHGIGNGYSIQYTWQAN